MQPARKRLSPATTSLPLLLWLLAFAGTAIAPLVARAGARDNAQAGKVRIVFAGDVMLDGGPGHALSHHEDVFADVAGVLKSADVAVCNLESALAKKGHGTHYLQAYTFKARPECIPVLRQYFSAVCVANNHAGDYGPDGFLEELTLLGEGKLAYFGGGRDIREAYRPLVLERRGRRVALLGYSEIPPRSYAAAEHRPGTAWLVPERAIAGVKAARAAGHADVVIPMLHWGHEIKPAPDAEQRDLARKLIDAGADAVIGGHPHVTQTVEIYKGRPIIYSLGNFVFDYYPGDPPVWTGWMARLTLTKSAPPDLEIFAVELDRAGIPHLLPKPAK